MTQNPAVWRSGRGVVWRVNQLFRTIAYRHGPEVDRKLRAVLQNEAQWELLLRLSAFDRAHHLRAHDALVAAGYADLDLLLAAALHDVGKADEHGRVRLVHRVLKAPLQAVSPRLLNRVARHGGGWLGHGLYFAQHLSRLVAELAQAAGASLRCSELIARHEEGLPEDDPELRVLIQADAGAIA